MTRPARRIDLTEARKDSAREVGEFVATKMGTVHVVVRGDGPDVVLLHGVTDNAHTWHGVQSELAGIARTHALDLPGHGLSDFPAKPLTARQMAEWVVAYLDAARVDRAVVLGWSLGGAVAAALSAGHGGRVSGLVLEAPAMLDFSFPIALMPLKIGGVGGTLYLIAANQALRRYFMASTFAHGFGVPEDIVERYWRGWQIKGRGRYIRALLREFKSTETTPLIDRISAPSWIVHGDQDQLVPVRVADELESRLPGAKLSRLTNVGHAPHVERPDVVLGALREAIRS